MATFNKNTTTADYGNENQAVGQLQSYLNTKGANLNVDNKYGDLTKAAVAKYGLPQSPNVTSANLAPVKESVLPDKIPSTYAGMPGAMESLAADARTQAEKERDTLRKEKDTSLDAYMKELIGSGSISSSVDRTAQDAAKKKSDIYTSQIEQEQLATRRRIEELQKNQVGMSATGLAVESERINRESLSKQADLAILQTAANREYDTAASIADRTVAMKMEQSNANLAALKFFYDENKSSFTKADDRIYAEVLAKKEAENRRLERNETAIAQLKLNVAQYGGGAALLSKLSAIDTTKADAYDKAVAIAGKYATDPLDRAVKQAKINKIIAETGVDNSVSTKILSTSQFKAAQAAQNLKNTLQKAKEAVDKYGNREKISGEGKGILDTLKVQLRSEISTALEQGVVVPGEAASFDAIAGELNKSFFIRNSKTKASLDSLSQSMDSRIKTQKAALTGTYKVTPEQIDSLLGVVSNEKQKEKTTTEEDVAKEYMEASSSLVWNKFE